MDISLLSDELKAVIEEFVKAELKKQLFAKDLLIAQQQEEIAHLNEQISSLRKMIFGSRSEKTIYIDPAQKSLFEKAESNNTADTTQDSHQEQSRVKVPAHERKPKRSMDVIYADLPHVEKIIDLPEEKKFDSNGKPFVYVGNEFVRSIICSEPSKHWIEDIYCKTYKTSRPESEDVHFVKPDIPSPLIEHSYASASTVSQIIINKYFAGLPLYRQEKLFKQQGLGLSRTTMANWVITVSEQYLNKIYLRLCRLIVEQKVVHADETPIQVLKEPGRRAQQKSYMWVYSTSKRSDIQIRCFSYEKSRSGERAQNFLKDFSGILISDGYSGYLKVDVTRAGCWAHMRRKWVEAMPTDLPSESSIAATGLGYCTQLFEFERRIEQLTDEERVIERQKIHTTEEELKEDNCETLSAKEILGKYWEWIDSLGTTAGKLKKAVGYALHQKPYLETFLEHGEIEISNNQVENAIRPFVVGRKGWLFADTTRGAEASAVTYSVIETAKANNLNVHEWLNYVLKVLPERFAYDPNDCIDDLLPWTDEMQKWFRLK